MNTSQPKIGIALGGGVVRGFAHLGVLQQLEEEGIEIEYVGGASVGALIGLLFAAGIPTDLMHTYASQLGWVSMARPIWPTRGFFSFSPLEKWLISMIGDLHFEDLARKFVVIAANLENGEEVKFNTGAVIPAVRASCSVPGLVEPARIDGKLLGDGGVVHNLPGTAVRELGASYIIGVDIFFPAYRSALGPFASGLAAVEIMVQRSGSGIEQVDCLIAPRLKNATYINFGKKEELIQIGREAATAAIPKIKADLGLLNA